MNRLAAATLVVTAVLALRAGAATAQAPWPTNGWPTAEPADRGIDPAGFERIDSLIRQGAYGNIDRMLVVKDGYLVVDRSYPNDYREISRGLSGPLGCGHRACDTEADVHQYNYLHPDHHPWYAGQAVHTLQSVTKSIAATVLAVAIARGDIAGVEQPLLNFFRDYDLSATDPRLRSATLDDLLTMRSGIEWHEQDRPLDSTNTTLQLEYSDDWIQFTLDQPMDAEPGTKWAYNSGGSHLMSGVVTAATGQFIDQYAEQHLFGPLGIANYHWKKTPTGYPDTEGGLYLEASDLAKIGYLYLRDGVWEGRRILPQGWVAAATARRVESVNQFGWGYGYQWWRVDRGGTVVWAGLGFGGQYLLVLPDHDLIGVANSWNVFGRRPQASLFGDFLQALIDAAAQAG